MSNTAQGSIVIKRLRNGDTLSISLDCPVALMQLYTDTNEVAPDWTVAANQPVITPNVVSARIGTAVKLLTHEWQYCGVTLSAFSGAMDSDGFIANTSPNWLAGMFAFKSSTGALKILKNLASTSNSYNDTLTYTGTVRVDGAEYTVTKTCEVVIQKAAANGYNGLIAANTTQLTNDVPSTVMKATLLSGTTYVTNFAVQWYKDDTAWDSRATTTSGDVQKTVTRTDVDGSQLFIAEYYASSTSTDVLCRQGIRIEDRADPIIVKLDITSGSQVSATESVVVTASLVNQSDMSAATVSGTVTWSLRVMNHDTLQEIRRESTNTVTVTHNDTDDASTGYHDVYIVAEASW